MTFFLSEPLMMTTGKKEEKKLKLFMKNINNKILRKKLEKKKEYKKE